MKKEYIRPELEIVEVEPVTMLALSPEGNMDVDGSQEPDIELSNRRRNFWDEIGGK